MSGGRSCIAEDGRHFRVYKQRCYHDECWTAKCECGERLTAHDFDADGAEASARACLASHDPRRGFGHLECIRVAAA